MWISINKGIMHLILLLNVQNFINKDYFSQLATRLIRICFCCWRKNQFNWSVDVRQILFFIKMFGKPCRKYLRYIPNGQHIRQKKVVGFRAQHTIFGVNRENKMKNNHHKWWYTLYIHSVYLLDSRFFCDIEFLFHTCNMVTRDYFHNMRDFFSTHFRYECLSLCAQSRVIKPYTLLY